jgi:hypothetical protein
VCPHNGKQRHARKAVKLLISGSTVRVRAHPPIPLTELRRLLLGWSRPRAFCKTGRHRGQCLLTFRQSRRHRDGGQMTPRPRGDARRYRGWALSVTLYPVESRQQPIKPRHLILDPSDEISAPMAGIDACRTADGTKRGDAGAQPRLPAAMPASIASK